MNRSTSTFVLSGSLLLAAACGGGSDVCSRLAKSPTCNDTAFTQCTDAIAKAKAESATCAPQVTALAECIAGLQEVECTGTTSVAVRGDGEFGGGQNFTNIGDVYKRQMRRSCSTVTPLGALRAAPTGRAAVGLMTALAEVSPNPSGIISRVPAATRFGFWSRFSAASWSTVVPNRFATIDSVSPDRIW